MPALVPEPSLWNPPEQSVVQEPADSATPMDVNVSQSASMLLLPDCASHSNSKAGQQEVRMHFPADHKYGLQISHSSYVLQQVQQDSWLTLRSCLQVKAEV